MLLLHSLPRGGVGPRSAALRGTVCARCLARAPRRRAGWGTARALATPRA